MGELSASLDSPFGEGDTKPDGGVLTSREESCKVSNGNYPEPPGALLKKTLDDLAT